jgi:hypothetical protein
MQEQGHLHTMEGRMKRPGCTYRGWVLLSPRPWDFPPSIDGDVSREDTPMELDEPKGAVGLD